MKLTATLAIISALLACQVNAAVSTSTPSITPSTKTSSTTTSTASSPPSTIVPLNGQCGGIGWTGPTVCAEGLGCTTVSDYYSYCYPYLGSGRRCGGIGYTSLGVCAPGLTCVLNNNWFHICSYITSQISASSTIPSSISTSTSTSSTTSSTSTSSSASSSTSTFLGVPEYGQCGGQGYAGPTVCAPGLTCVRNNDYFYNCYYVTSTSTTTSTSTSVVPVVPEYGQCGGLTWKGNTVCASGLTCVRLNDYFYQCLNQATSTV